MIDKIVFHPRAVDRDYELELHGELAAILKLAQGDPQGESNLVVELVAGARYETYLTPSIRVMLKPAA